MRAVLVPEERTTPLSNACTVFWASSLAKLESLLCSATLYYCGFGLFSCQDKIELIPILLTVCVVGEYSIYVPQGGVQLTLCSIVRKEAFGVLAGCPSSISDNDGTGGLGESHKLLHDVQ
jgi:hypothetical protein